MVKVLEYPLTKQDTAALRCGDEVAFSGIVYTARDQAHKRLAALLERGKPLPFDLRNQMIYYCGPNPAAPGRVIGSCGPTTSQRMDVFTPVLLKHGLLGMIGKGERSPAVVAAIKQYRAIYYITHAGCGALLSEYVTKADNVCFSDLGAEAVFRLEVKQFPLIVAIDTEGRSLYDTRGKKKT